MKKRRQQFYVPNTDFWRWELLTDTYLRVQLARVSQSYGQTENALGVLDERVIHLGQLTHQWQSGQVPHLREIIESDYKDIQTERKRILAVQDRIVQEMDRIRAELKARKIDTDRRLPT